MRKIPVLSLCTLLVVASFSACSGDDDPGSGPGTGGSGGSGATGGSSAGAGTGASAGASGSGGAPVDASLDSAPDASVDAAVDAPPDVDLADGFVNTAACRVYFQAMKSKFDECAAKAGGASAAWGQDTNERIVEHCGLELAAAGTTATLNDLQSCSAQLQAQGCTAFIASPQSICFADPESPYCTRYDPGLLACKPPQGTLNDGSACFAHLQCQSGYCKGAQGGCGVCTPRATSGKACQHSADCVLSLACAGGKCVAPLAPGASCGASSAPCAWGASCAGGKCVAWQPIGAGCGSNLGQCDPRLGLSCVGGKCAKTKLLGPGANCTPADTQCFDESVCSGGSCTDKVEDGSKCDASLGCKVGSSCRGGICSRDNPAYCF